MPISVRRLDLIHLKNRQCKPVTPDEGVKARTMSCMIDLRGVEIVGRVSFAVCILPRLYIESKL